jgi:hypothetical protein
MDKEEAREWFRQLLNDDKDFANEWKDNEEDFEVWYDGIIKIN